MQGNPLVFYEIAKQFQCLPFSFAKVTAGQAHARARLLFMGFVGVFE